MKISPFSAVSTFFLILLTHPLCSAQSIDPYAEARDRDSVLQDYRALQQGRSATPDADAALSADVIVDLLRRQPALKLQVKRVLIQRALDQGRLLAEEDLGDTELFDLIRDQFTIRKIASDEIEKRHYLLLRPTDEEAFEARLNQRRVEQLENGEGNRPEREEANRSPAVRAGAPSGNVPSSPQQPSFKDGGPGSLSPDDRALPRVSPSELPQLLTASAELGGASSSEGLSSRPSTTQASLLVPSITPEPALPSEREVIDGVNQPRPSTHRVVQGSAAENSDRTFRKKPNPYAMVPSLYDLYEQSPAQGRSLERFGASVFENGTGNVDQLPMDVPVGPDYVIGPGDGLNVDLWGSVSQRLQRVVDREGRLSLPEKNNEGSKKKGNIMKEIVW